MQTTRHIRKHKNNNSFIVSTKKTNPLFHSTGSLLDSTRLDSPVDPPRMVAAMFHPCRTEASFIPPKKEPPLEETARIESIDGLLPFADAPTRRLERATAVTINFVAVI
jgi:hypothetical protein